MRLLIKIIRVVIITVVVVAAAAWLFMQQPSFGKTPSGDRLARIEKSARYKDGHFVNRINTPMYPAGVSMPEVMWKFAFADADHSTPLSPIPFVKRDLRETPPTDAPVVTWFGHSSVLLQVGGKNILTDPQFSQRASPVPYAGPKAFDGADHYVVEDLPEIDAVLISHDHYDHLDYNTIIQLKDKAKNFFVPLGVASHLEYWGIPIEKIHEVDWWEETSLDHGLKIVATPSRHFSGRGLSFGKTSWGSYVVIMNDHRVFFSGDSGFDVHYYDIGQKYGPFDIALIETGQYNELWPYIHMMPEQSVQAAEDLKAKLMLPVHWSKFKLALHEWDEPVIRASKKAKTLGVNIITPNIGELVRTDSLPPFNAWWETVKK